MAISEEQERAAELQRLSAQSMSDADLGAALGQDIMRLLEIRREAQQELLGALGTAGTIGARFDGDLSTVYDRLGQLYASVVATAGTEMLTPRTTVEDSTLFLARITSEEDRIRAMEGATLMGEIALRRERQVRWTPGVRYEFTAVKSRFRFALSTYYPGLRTPSALRQAFRTGYGEMAEGLGNIPRDVAEGRSLVKSLPRALQGVMLDAEFAEEDREGGKPDSGKRLVLVQPARLVTVDGSVIPFTTDYEPTAEGPKPKRHYLPLNDEVFGGLTRWAAARAPLPGELEAVERRVREEFRKGHRVPVLSTTAALKGGGTLKRVLRP